MAGLRAGHPAATRPRGVKAEALVNAHLWRLQR